jgi:hypothetical protein
VRRWILLFLIFKQNIGLTAGSNLSAEASQIENSGYISLRSLQNENSDGSNTNLLSGNALLKSKLKLDNDLLKIQLRPLLTHATNTSFSEASAYVDELYWERRLSPSSFTFLGRRKIVNGVAIGRNPLDFFNQSKNQDRTLTDDDRRAEIEGDEMIGWSYFGQSYSLQSLLVAPDSDSKRIRAMLQVNGNLNSLSTDISFIAYYANRPSLGMNLSTVLGENVTAYAEAGLRKGRDRQSPLLSRNDVVVGVAEDANRWIADVVIGGLYTTGGGITLTAEYWRNNNGFSDMEYAGIANSLTSGQGNPRLAGTLLSTPGLRKNSAFVRIGDIPLFDALKCEITLIRNVDDSSSFVRGAGNWDISKADSLRIGIDRFYGSKLSEYGSSKIDGRIFLIYKRFF